MRQYLTGEKVLNLVRVLIIVEIVVMLVSTAVAVGVESLVCLLFILSAELRKRFVASLKQPMVLMSMLLYAMITAGLFYGLASWEEGVDFWSSWRKLLLVPLTVSIFDDPLWKQRMALIFTGVCLSGAVISCVIFLIDFEIYKFDPGIVFTNHGTQGMAFALAIFASFVLLRFFPHRRKGFWLGVVALVVITANLIFITPGRSGYMAFLVFGMVTIFATVSGKRRYGLFIAMPILVGLFLMISPVAKDRIMLGLTSIKNADTSDQYTGMAIRMVMWKNTLGILKDQKYPAIIGYGTGGFKEAYRPQVAGQTGWKAEVVDDCHNQYLRIAVEHGVLGLLLFLGFIAACFRQAVERPFKLLGIGALLGWCATSFFSGHFGTFVEGRLIFIWLGTMLAMTSAAAADSPSIQPRM